MTDRSAHGLNSYRQSRISGIDSDEVALIQRNLLHQEFCYCPMVSRLVHHLRAFDIGNNEGCKLAAYRER